MRLGLVMVALAFVGAAEAPLAQSEVEELGGKVRAGGEVVVPAGEEVAGDLYLTGGTVLFEGDLEGDLVAAGGQVRVSGTVGGDALLTGGDVSVSGDVAGATRVAAGQFALTGSTGEDLAAAAGRVRIGERATVGQDLLFSAGQVLVHGAVDGDVLGTAGDYQETGTVAGSREVAIRADEGAPTLADRILQGIQWYATLLIVGALLVGVAPRLGRRAAEHMATRPLPSLGVGALGLLAALAGSVVILIVAGLLTALFSLLGLGGLAALSISSALLMVAVVAFVAVTTSALLAPVLVGLWLGGYAVDRDRGRLASFGALALGTLVVVILTRIPFVGSVVDLLVALLGVGALLLRAWARLRGADSGQTRPVASGGQEAG